MSDQKLTDLTEVNDLDDEDLLYAVIDPSGSPLSRGINRGNTLSRIKLKEPVRAATVSAGTLASDFEDGDTIDGVVLATGDRILIKNQAAPAENGVYVVAASGAPTRATDYDTDPKIRGALVAVQEGTVNSNKIFKNTNTSAITVNTTGITFTDITSYLLAFANTWAEFQTLTKGARNTPGTLTYGATATIDFDTSEILTVTLTGNIDFNASSGAGAGRHKMIRIVGDGSTRTLAFHADWKFVGAKPTQLAANKIAILTLTCFGSNNSDIVAGYAVQT